MELMQHIETIRALDEQLTRVAKARGEVGRGLEDYYFVVNKEIRYLYASLIEKQSAINATDMIGKHWSDLGFPAEVMEPVENDIKQVFKTGERLKRQAKGAMLALTGNRQLEYTLTPLYWQSNVEAVGCTAKDITEKFNDSKVVDILDSITDGVLVVDNEWCFTYLNQAARRIIGTYPTEDLLGKSIWEGFPPLADYQQSFINARTEHTVVCFEVYAVAARKWLEIHAYPAKEGLMFWFHDIENRKRMENAFLKCEQQYKTLVENIPCAIVRLDRELRYLYVNPAMGRYVGISADQFIGRTWKELGCDEACVSAWIKPFETTFQTGALVKMHTEAPSTGGMKYYSHYFVPEFGLNGTIETALGIIIDITEQKRMEEELRQRTQEFKTIVENSPSIIIRYDNKNLRCVYANPALEVICGVPVARIIGKDWQDLADEDKFNINWSIKCLEVFQTGQPAEFDLEFRGVNGIRYGQANIVPEFSQSGDVGSILAIVRDITERRCLETEMTRLDKLNLIGEMAASIGHEVRNPMTTVRGFLQMFQENTNHARNREKFTLMIEELDRANAIITEFLSLAKNKLVELEPGNINKVFDTLFPLIQADALRLGHNIWIEKNDIPDLLINKGEVRQLLLNLVRNGLESMDNCGMVTIKTYLTNDSVCLSVQDKGKGIPPEVLDKLGTPFITTKDSGAGLGLAVCYRIAERHKAKIEIKTGPKGTTVIVRFNINSLA